MKLSSVFSFISLADLSSVSCIILHLSFSVSLTGSLHFAYVEASDRTASGETYACYLKNTVLDMTYSGSYAHLSVTRGLPC